MSATEGSTRLPLEACEVDLERGVVWRGPQCELLTTRERQLLDYLARHPGEPLSRAELLREVWGFRGRTPSSRAPDFTVLRLRAKVERDPERPRHITTEFGTGYRFLPLRAGEAPLPVALPEAPVDDLLEPHQPSDTQGPLPPGTPYAPEHFIGRAALRREARALLARPGAPVVLTGSAGIGKSWLLGAILEDAAADALIVRVNLRHLSRSTLVDPARLFAALQAEIGEATDVDPLEGPPERAFRRTLEAACRAAPSRLLLAIDHADEARHLPDPSALFAQLRAACERTRAPWDRARLVLAISTEPELLVDRPELSPFNLAPPLHVGDLAEAELEDLVVAAGLSGSATLAAVIGGHPGLARWACYRAGRDGRALAEVVRDGQCFAEPLGRIARVLAENPTLAAAFASACASPPGPADLRSLQRLRRAGLLGPAGEPQPARRLFRALLQ